MAFMTTPQTVNQVIKTITETYGVPAGIARKALRETGYQLSTTSGFGKYNRDQMATIWTDLDQWIGNWKR